MLGRIARYAGGAAAAWLVFTVQGIIAYLVLLVYATISNADIGGPLAGPFMVLLAGMVGAVLIPVAYVPTLVVVELVRSRVSLRGRVLIAGAMLVAIVGSLVALVSILTDVSGMGTFGALLIGWASVLLPATASALVVYWLPALTKRFFRRPNGQPPIFNGFSSI
ncbi:hypothetical protein AB0J14_26040 [Micromonospora arborensis]|uniref:hypothetical protein n=1 Tax=Micromonospora arborensis TaxID=2116518 RepID=UPI0034042411